MSKRNKRHNRRSASKPVVESLENRQLLSGTVTLAVASNVLTITGDASANAILIEDSGVGTFNITGTDGTSVTYSGETSDPDTPVAVAGAYGLTINFGQGGNDRVDAANKLVLTDAAGVRYAFSYTGGAGNDTVFSPTGASGMLGINDATGDVAEEQTLTFSGATDGNYTITWDGHEFNPLAYDADAAAVQAELETFGALTGNVTVAGVAGAFTVTFDQSLSDVAQMTVVSTMTDGQDPVDVTVETSVPGSNVGDCATGSVTISQVDDVAATGSITFASRPKAGDRFTLNDGQGNIRAYTAVSGTPNRALGQFQIKATAALTMADAILTINGGPILEITALVDGVNAAKVNLTNDNDGATGNQAVIVSSFSASRIKAVNMAGGSSTNAEQDDSVVLDDGANAAVTFTFGSGEGEVAIGNSAIATAANLAAAINAIGAELLITAYENGDGSLTLVQDLIGSAGNTTITVDGDNLAKVNFAGGADVTNLSDGDSVIVGDGVNDPIEFIARTTPTLATEFQIGGSAGRTMASLVAAINLAYDAEDILVSATDYLDGSCELVNDITGVLGNYEVTVAGANFAATGLEGGLGGGIDCLSATVTLGNGTNFVGIGSQASGQSTVYGDVSITGGTGDDTVVMYGVYVAGNTSMTLNTSASNDSVLITDDGDYSSFLCGNLTITQTDGVSTITLEDDPGLLVVGGNLSINVGATAAGTSVTTLDNLWVDGQLLYTGGTGNDTLDMINGVLVADLATINMGSGTGTNILDAADGLSVGSLTGGALSYTGGSGNDTVTLDSASTHKGAATFTMGDGTNSLTIDDGEVDGNFSYTGGTGDDTLDIGETGFMERGSFTVTAGAGSNSLTLDNADVNGFSYTGGANNDTLVIGETSFKDVGAFAVKGNAATSSIPTSADGTNSLTMDNAMIVGAVSYTSGNGADSVTIGDGAFDGRSTVTLAMGNGVGTATLNGRSRGVTYTGGTAADTLTLGDLLNSGGYTMDGDLSFTGGGGGDTLNFDGMLRNLTYTGSVDADAFNLGVGGEAVFQARGNVTINAGTATSTGATNGAIKNANIRGAFSFTGANGVDTLNIGQGAAVGMTVGKSVTVSLNSGDDILRIDNSKLTQLSGSATITTGAGADTIALDVAGTSATTFYRQVTFNNSGGGVDIFTDRAIGGTHGTKYVAATNATKPTFTAFRSSSSLINGADDGTILGTALITPSYT